MGTRGKLSFAARVAQNGGGRCVAEPKPPKDLNSEAQKEWRRITGLLRQRNALDALDQVALHDYLVCWCRINECEQDITKRGVLVQGERGMVKNPALQAVRIYRDALVTWSKELGLTHGSRARLSMPQTLPPKANRFLEFENRYPQEAVQQTEDEDE